MWRILLLLTSSFYLLSCGTDQTDAAQVGQSAGAPSSQDVPMSGQEIYETVCGTCHESGVDGAPITSRAADWADRSPLWQAVLMEHAEAGYLDMPAKGGHGELSDEEVDAAVLYMLGIAFPDRPAE